MGLKIGASQPVSSGNPWIQIRGLNASFAAAVQAELAKDPLADLGRFFEQYLGHWTKISDASSGEVAGSVGAAKAASPTTAASEAAKPFSFSQPPAKPATTASEAAKPFSFGQPSAKPFSVPFSDASKIPEPMVPALASQEPKSLPASQFTAQVSQESRPFAFTIPAVSQAEAPLKMPTQAPQEPKPFAFTMSQTTPMAKTEAGTASQAPFVFNAPTEQSKPDASGPTKPFSFAFSQESQPSAEPSKPFAFSFNTPAPSAFGLLSPEPTQTQKEGEADDDAPLEPAQIGVIRTGAGEEGEQCMAEVRVKLFTFEKADGWVDLGVGILKVNQRKEEGAMPNRILCRTEASGAILLNSAISKDVTKVEFSEGKRDLKLHCVNQLGKMATYMVRTKDGDQAKQVADAINSLSGH